MKEDIVHVFRNKDIPKPGDMIQFQMPLFQHWGIYVGNGDVVHFALPGNMRGGRGEDSRHKFSLIQHSLKVRKAKVKNVSPVLTYAVYNKYDKDHSPLPPEHVVKRAEHMVGKIIKYDPGRANCEHFVTLMRYNVAISRQVRLPCILFLITVFMNLAPKHLNILKILTTKTLATNKLTTNIDKIA
uniref:LRAT domain-containing protein n=1 Tax=Anolis carolinensis TaxID=28377 RepID=G1KM41_ANOCA